MRRNTLTLLRPIAGWICSQLRTRRVHQPLFLLLPRLASTSRRFSYGRLRCLTLALLTTRRATEQCRTSAHQNDGGDG